VIAAVNPALKIEYQSYAAAYSEDFEDIRRRVPDLSRVRRTIDYRLDFDIDRIIAELIGSPAFSTTSSTSGLTGR